MASGESLEQGRGSVTSEELKRKMDSLVTDLTHALDDSQLPQNYKRRRGFKRRTRIINSLGYYLFSFIFSF